MPEQFHGSVHIEGLDVLMRSFGRVDKGLKRQLQKRLRVVGRIVAEQAKGIAEFHRLRGDEKSGYGDTDPHPGQLIRLIKPSVRGSSVFIRDSARTKSPKYPQGYNYPARFEYENQGAKSFMRPALETRRSEIEREFEEIVTWIATEWGRGA